MSHGWKNGSQLEKLFTLGKMCHTWKNGPHTHIWKNGSNWGECVTLKKYVTLGKMCRTWKSVVSFAAVFRLVTQRSSPQTAAFFRTTFLTLCLSVQTIDQSYHNHCLKSNQSNWSKKTFPRISESGMLISAFYSSVVAKKEKLYTFGRSSIDFCEIIKSALNMNVRNFSASEQLFICRAQCYQRLTKFKRALNNFKKAKSELEEIYKATVHRTKRHKQEDWWDCIKSWTLILFQDLIQFYWSTCILLLFNYWAIS